MLCQTLEIAHQGFQLLDLSRGRALEQPNGKQLQVKLRLLWEYGEKNVKPSLLRAATLIQPPKKEREKKKDAAIENQGFQFGHVSSVKL